MCMRDENYEIGLQIKTNNKEEKEILGEIISLVFNTASCREKYGVEMLELIAKNGNEDILEDYFDSMIANTTELANIFHKAIQRDCTELVKLMIRNHVYLDSDYSAKQNAIFMQNALEIPKKDENSEMYKIITNLCEKLM